MNDDDRTIDLTHTVRVRTRFYVAESALPDWVKSDLAELKDGDDASERLGDWIRANAYDGEIVDEYGSDELDYTINFLEEEN